MAMIEFLEASAWLGVTLACLAGLCLLALMRFRDRGRR